MTPDQRLYTLQLSRRDLGWVLNGLDTYRDVLIEQEMPHKEILHLANWLEQIYEGAPDTPAYFWLGEESERIVL